MTSKKSIIRRQAKATTQQSRMTRTRRRPVSTAPDMLLRTAFPSNYGQYIASTQRERTISDAYYMPIARTANFGISSSHTGSKNTKSIVAALTEAGEYSRWPHTQLFFVHTHQHIG